jgi:hypothetical protein
MAAKQYQHKKDPVANIIPKNGLTVTLKAQLVHLRMAN